MIQKIKDKLKSDTTNKVWEVVLLFVLGSLAAFLIGWILFGWFIVPVEWEYPEVMEANLNTVSFRSKAAFVYLLQEWYAYSGDDEKFNYFASQMNDLDSVACFMSNQTSDFAEQARLIKVAYLVNGYGCLE
jgi:hypothetical protein